MLVGFRNEGMAVRAGGGVQAERGNKGANYCTHELQSDKIVET